MAWVSNTHFLGDSRTWQIPHTKSKLALLCGEDQPSLLHSFDFSQLMCLAGTQHAVTAFRTCRAARCSG